MVLAAVAAVAALSVVGGWGPAARAAASEVTPSEPPASILPGATIQAIAADLDADGSREVVRLIAGDVDPYRVFLDVWTDAGAAWRRIGEPAGVMRFGTSTEASYQDVLPVATDELARLILWRDGGREHVLVATAAAEDYWFVPCCFTVSGVAITADSVELAVLTTESTSVDAVLAADLDADGTDELVAREASLSGTGRRFGVPIVLRAYRWDGERFVDHASVELSPPTTAQVPTVLENSDGLAGDEVVIAEPGDEAQLTRVSLDGHGSLVTEVARVDVQATGPLGVAALPTERESLVVVSASRTLFAEWPAGREMRVTRIEETGGRLLGVLGSARASQAVIADEPAGHVRLVDTAADEPVLLGPSREAAGLLDASPGPYAGRFPGGVRDGTPAIAYAGRLVLAPRSHGVGRFTGIASLTGAQPLGLVGRDGSTMALLHVTSPAVNLDSEGGLLHAAHPLPGARVTLVAAEATLGPGAGLPQPVRPVLHGAVAEQDPSGTWNVAASADGFAVTLAAPPGSRVGVAVAGRQLADRLPADELIVPSTGRIGVRVPTSLLPTSDEAVPARLVVITPAGHAHSFSGMLTVVRSGPELTVETPVAPLSFDVPVSGSTAPGARVVVAGERVAVDPSGAFATSVPAGLLPASVRVEAVDAIGNRTVREASVVAVLDYRRLPWVPAAAAAIVVAAMVAFWRRPARAARADAGSSADGVTLEEIDGP